MADIVFTPLARQDLVETGDYIAHRLHNRSAARNLIRRIQSTVSVLEQFPDSGTPLEVSGVHILYRYLICGSCMIFYHLSGGNRISKWACCQTQQALIFTSRS